MIKAIMNGILKALTGVVGFLLTPINTLVSTLFPDMAVAIANFNNFVNTYFTTTLSYFFNLLPPIFRSMLGIWFTFVISYYGIYYSYIAIVKVFNVIQKVKFW